MSYNSLLLPYASEFGCLGLVRCLVKKKTNVNARSRKGNTPLHWAAEKNRLAIAEILLANGADINALNQNGQTPLHRAVHKNHLEMVAFLLQNGPGVNIQDSDEQTPLCLALRKYKPITIINLLKEHGAIIMEKTAPTKQLKWLVDLLDKHRINYWLDSGTLLGVIREGKVLDHDKDIDLGAWADQVDKIEHSLVPELQNCHYGVKKRRYRGLIHKYIFSPNLPSHSLTQPPAQPLKIHLNIFQETGGYAWCPWSGILRRKTKWQGSRFNPGYIAFKIRDKLSRLANKHIREIKLARFPYCHIFDIGTWWIPASFFKELTRDPKFNAAIPAQYRGYLAFRYGNWQVPSRIWDCTRDDPALKKEHPAKVIRSLKHNGPTG